MVTMVVWRQAMNLRGTGSILSCAATASSGVPLLFTGSEDGMFTTWDLRCTTYVVSMYFSLQEQF